MRKENELLENKEMRNNVAGRIEVLEQVKELLLLNDNEFATTEMVAKYYNTKESTIKDQVQTNKDEFDGDGYIVLVKDELKIAKDKYGIKSRASSMALFNKRSILRMGMLLRDSEVAKEIRSRLLDIAYDSETENASISNIVEEINEETILQRQLGEAYFKGDLDLVLVTTTKINTLKNKRIQELENVNKVIINHSTTIEESRSVVNRLIRIIASKTGMFGKVWNEFYSKINYKLGINLKARKQKPLDSMSKEEMFEAEIIARNWATKIGIDVESVLSLS